MALIPELALQARPPQVGFPDFGRTMMLAAQLQDAQRQRQLQELAFGEAMERRQRLQAMNEYLREGGNGATLQELAQPTPVMADRVPQRPPGTYLQDPRQSPTYAMQQLSPGTQAPPGTTYSRAPEHMQPRQTQPVPQRHVTAPASLDARELLRRGGTEALPILQALRQDRVMDAQVQGQEASRKLQELQLQMKMFDMVDNAYNVVVDQPSLNAAKQQLAKISPEFGAMLPDTYDKDDMDRRRAQLVPIRQRLQQSQVGLTPLQAFDAQGNPAVLQLSQSGQAVATQLPPGYRLAPHVQKVDTATGTVLVGPGGRMVTEIPKNLEEAERQKQAGEEVGKQVGQRLPMARKAQESLAQLEQKHAVVERAIEKAIKLVDTSPLPTTGVIGNFLKAIYQPGTDLASTLETIGANVGFAELQAIRETSPQGGALGPVSDFENRQLQAVIGSLKQSQSADQFKQNLRNLSAFLAESRERRQQAYQRDFSEVLEPPVQRKTITRAQIRELARKRGVSETDVEQRARSGGYRVTD